MPLIIGFGYTLPAKSVGAAPAATTNADAWYQQGYNQGHAFYNPGAKSPTPSQVHSLHRVYSVQTLDSAGLTWALAPAISGTLGYETGDDTTLRAFNVRTGRKAWTASLKYCTVEPAVIHESVVVAVTIPCTPDDFYGEVTAFDAATGKHMWTSPDVQDGYSSATAEGGRVFVNSRSGLQAYSVKTGQLLWTDKLSLSSIAAVNSEVLVRAGTSLQAYAPATGKLLWKHSVSGLSITYGPQPVQTDGSRIFVQSSTFNPPSNIYTEQIFALDMNGAPVWSWQNSGGFSGSASLASNGSTVIVGGADGKIHALKQQTGQELWGSAQLGNLGSAAIGAGVAYSTYSLTSGAGLVAFNLSTGQQLLKTVPNSAYNLSELAVAQASVFTSFETYNLMAFRP